jgi:ABC-2 type transport system permease protein
MSAPASTSATPATGAITTATVVAGKTLRTTARTPQLIIATLAQGVLFLLVFRYVFGGAITTGPLRYIDYMTPGILTAGVIFAASTAAVGVAEDHAQGFGDRVLSLPTSRPGLVVGRTIADAVVVIAATAITALAATAIGFRAHAPATDILGAAGLIVLYALAFAALFGALGAVADGPEAAQALGFIAIPVTFVSSAYVPTDTMPSWLAAIARNQPVTHMINAVRDLTQSDIVGQELSTVALAAVWAASLALASGTISIRQTRR